MKKFYVFFMVSILLGLCFGYACAANEVVYEYGLLRLHLPEGLLEKSPNSGIYVNEQTDEVVQIASSLVGDEEVSTIDDSLILEATLEYLGFAYHEIQELPNGVTYVVPDLKSDSSNLKMAILYYRGTIISVAGFVETLNKIVQGVEVLPEKADVTRAINVRVIDEYYLLERGNVALLLPEYFWNVIYYGMPEDSASLSRLGLTKEQADDKMLFSAEDVLISPVDDQSGLQIQLGISEVGNENMSMLDGQYVLQQLVEEFSSDYEKKTVNGIVYYVFDAGALSDEDNIETMPYQSVYATIVGGKLFFYSASKPSPLTGKDKRYLFLVVENATYLKANSSDVVHQSEEKKLLVGYPDTDEYVMMNMDETYSAEEARAYAESCDNLIQVNLVFSQDGEYVPVRSVALMLTDDGRSVGTQIKLAENSCMSVPIMILPGNYGLQIETEPGCFVLTNCSIEANGMCVINYSKDDVIDFSF